MPAALRPAPSAWRSRRRSSWGRTASQRSTRFYRSRIRSDARLDYERLDPIFAGRAKRAGARSPSRWRSPAKSPRPSASTAAPTQPRRRVLRAGVPLRLERARSPAPAAVAQTESHRLIERLMILTNEQVAELLERKRVAADLPRPRPARPGPDRATARAAGGARGADPAAAPGALAPQQAGEIAAEASRLVRRRGGAARTRPRGVYIARAPLPEAGLTTASETAATPASAAPPTVTSPRRSVATPTCSCTAPCWRRWGRERRRRGWPRPARWPPHCSEQRARVGEDRARRRRYLRRLPARAGAGASVEPRLEFEGEVSGADPGRRLRLLRRRARRRLRGLSAGPRGCRGERFELNRDRDRPGRPRSRATHCGSVIRVASRSAGSKRPGAGSIWSPSVAKKTKKPPAGLGRRRHQPPRPAQIRAGGDDGGGDSRCSGSEVKSLRGGKAQMTDAYAVVEDGEVWLRNLHIPLRAGQPSRTTSPSGPASCSCTGPRSSA